MDLNQNNSQSQIMKLEMQVSELMQWKDEIKRKERRKFIIRIILVFLFIVVPTYFSYVFISNLNLDTVKGFVEKGMNQVISNSTPLNADGEKNAENLGLENLDLKQLQDLLKTATENK